MRDIAATAEPVDSLSANIVSSSRASASAQNCQAEASRERPIGSFGTPRITLIPAAVGKGVLAGVEDLERENGTAAVADKERCRPGVRRREESAEDGRAGIIGLGGELDISALTNSARPSKLNERRTLLVDGFGSDAGVGRFSLSKESGSGQLEGVCPFSLASLSSWDGVMNPPFSPVLGVMNLAALLFWLIGVPQMLDIFQRFARYPGVCVG